MYDEVELEDMEWNGTLYTYPCPCGDFFRITKQELEEGEDVARCPSCTLWIRVIYSLDETGMDEMEMDDE